MDKQFQYAVIDEPKYPFNPNQQAINMEPSFRQTQLYKKQRQLVVRIPARGSHYLYGPSNSYDQTYPKQLIPYVSQEEFKIFIGEVNGQLEKYWPCLFSFIIAYTCCITTCLFSLLLPKLCIDDVVKFLHYVLERWNETLNPRGIYVDWGRSCSTSYIEFSVNNDIHQRFQQRIFNDESKTQQTSNLDEIELDNL